MTEIWFIRHGETEWNRERRIQGWQDTALNAAGRAQALRLAARLHEAAGGTPFAALYSSDLQRARATAQPVAAKLGLDLRAEPGIRERRFGVLEGLELGRMDELAPEAAAAWKSRDPARALEGGEALGEFRRRIVEAVEELARRHAGARVLAFTHGGVLDIVWREAQGLPLDAPRNAPLLNASINRVRVSPGRWRMLEWGDVAHAADGEDDASA